MTNTELLAKIKAEIESLKSIEYPCDNSQQATGFFNALDRMTDFLSTLESEKPMNPEAAMKALDEKIALVKQRGTWDGVDVDKYMDEVRGREPEKPVPNDLEEYASRAGFDYVDNIVQEHPGHRFNDHDVEYAYRDGIIAGAKWQENKDQETIKLAEDHAFLAGADWQKEQMMKDGDEGIVRGLSAILHLLTNNNSILAWNNSKTWTRFA